MDVDAKPVLGRCLYGQCSCALYICSSNSSNILCTTCGHSGGIHKITGYLRFTPTLSPPTQQQQCLPPFNPDYQSSNRKMSAEEAFDSNKRAFSEQRTSRQELQSAFGRNRDDSITTPIRQSGNSRFGVGAKRGGLVYDMQNSSSKKIMKEIVKLDLEIFFLPNYQAAPCEFDINERNQLKARHQLISPFDFRKELITPQSFFDAYCCDPLSEVSQDFIDAGKRSFGFYIQKGTKAPDFSRFQHFSYDTFPEDADFEGFAVQCNPKRADKKKCYLVVSPFRPPLRGEVIEVKGSDDEEASILPRNYHPSKGFLFNYILGNTQQPTSTPRQQLSADEEEEADNIADEREEDRSYSYGPQPPPTPTDIPPPSEMMIPIDLTGGTVSSSNEELSFEKVPPVSSETIKALENSREEYPYEDGLCCGICHEPIKKNHPIITFKCTHFFHKWECTIPWLKKSGVCPYCRAHVE